jgi:tetratricopeptide (TPR) repeat protein
LKVRSAGATRVTGATKVRTKGKGKVSIVVRAPKLPKLTALPPLPPPEPPRRQVPSAVLRAFEQAVKIFNRRQYAEAKAMFENLQPRFPNEVEIIARAQTYIQVCNQKLAHTPSVPRNADELYDRGVFALNIGDFTQARTFFEKALRLRPDEPHLLYSLAATHAQTGSHDQAIDYLRRSIQIQPRFRSQALNDSDFSGLRENKQFLELLGLTSPFERLDSRR